MSEFAFLEELASLSPERQERFKRVVARLMNGEVLSPGEDGPLAAPDPDWRFLGQHRHLVDAYLQLAGWQIEFLAQDRLARAIHQGGLHRVRFNLLESLIACLLRQVYHEQMADGIQDARCEVTAGDLRERVAQAQRSSAPVTKKILAHAVRRLSRYGLAMVKWGFSGEDDESIVISPLIEAVLSANEVKHFFDRYANPVCEEDSQIATFETAEADDEAEDDDPDV